MQIDMKSPLILISILLVMDMHWAAADSYEHGESSVEVYPSLSITEMYDDNIFATPDNEIDDYMTIISPELRLKALWPKGRIDFGVGAHLGRYIDNKNEDFDDYWTEVTGRYQVSREVDLTTGVNVAQEHESRETPDEANGILPTEYDHLNYFVARVQENDQFFSRFGLTFERLDYENVLTSNGEIDNDDRDRNLYSAGGRWGVISPHGIRSFVQAMGDFRIYDLKTDDNGFKRSSYGFNPALGLEYRPLAKWNAEVLVGYIFRWYDEGRFSDMRMPDFGANLSYKISPSTQAVMSYNRSVEETTLTNASSYISDSIKAHIDHQLNKKWKLGGHIGLGFDNFQGISRQDDYFQAGTKLRFEITEGLFMSGEYLYKQRKSTINEADFDNNIFLVRIEGMWPIDKLDITPSKSGGADISKDKSNVCWEEFIPYVGGQIMIGDLQTHTSGPRGEDGVDEGDFSDAGPLAGLFVGLGKTFGRIYTGFEIEGALSDQRWDHAKDKTDGRTFLLEKEYEYGISGRLGYWVTDQSLVYTRIGIVEAKFASEYSPDNVSLYQQENTEWGLRYGLGMEIPALNNDTFFRLDYAYTQYQDFDIHYENETEKFETSESTFQLGIGWRFGPGIIKSRNDLFTDYNAPYAGAFAGYGFLNTPLDALHQDGNNPGVVSNLNADFGDHGFIWGIFAGIGRLFKRIFVGVEAETEISDAAWHHVREPQGRSFSVNKKNGYGFAVRLGYLLNDGSLIYLRTGPVWAKFNTKYQKGNAAYWVDRDDTQIGLRWGGGIDVPVKKNISIRMEYVTTQYKPYEFLTGHDKPDEVKFKNDEGLFRCAIVFRF